MEDISDQDYMHAKRVLKDFEIKNVDEYHHCILKVIHYFWLMFLKTLEKLFKSLSVRSFKISFSSKISMTSSFKKD